jgi:hypothetical protein
MTRVIVLAAVALALTGCGSTAAGTSAAAAGPGPGQPSSSPAASNATAGTGRCDAITDAVHALAPGTAGRTDKTVYKTVFCTWDSTEKSPAGLRYYVHVILDGPSTYDTWSKDMGLRESDAPRGVVKVEVTGLDASTGFWNGRMGTLALAVRKGDHSALIEAATPQQPSSDVLAALAHALVG